MKSWSSHRTLFAAMLCTLMLSVPSAAFAFISNQGSTFFSMSNDLGGFSEFQPLAVLQVGNADVNVGQFGVYGAAEAAGQIRWVIFDTANTSNPVYLSGTQGVSPQGLMWYDSPGIGATLSAGQTYAMGVVASNLFAWGWTDAGAAPITQNGLTLPVRSEQAQVTVDGAGHFAGNPLFVADFDPLAAQTSLRVAAAIPEPAEWSMLIAGLLVIGFIARRRNKMLPHPTEA
jgi:hypothetical protein